MRRFRSYVAALVVVPLALLATGCGSDDEPEPEAGSTSGGEGAEPFPGVTVAGEPGEEPTVEIADTPFEVEETTTEVLAEGDGAEVAEGDQALLQYSGINGRTGEEFDSSWSRGEPATFPLEPGGLIQGFLDGLIGQTYGSRVAIAIPPADGYGEAGQPQAGIEGGDTLVFVVDLLEAAPEPLSMAEGQEQDPPADLPELRLNQAGEPTGFAATPDTPESADGLVAFPVIEGEGPELQEGQTATVHYVGQIYPDGKVFDASWPRGEPAQFPLTEGGLIPGFLDGLIGQTVGSRVIIVIPSRLGYGPQGQPPAIPGDADLVFAVDVLAAS